MALEFIPGILETIIKGSGLMEKDRGWEFITMTNKDKIKVISVKLNWKMAIFKASIYITIKMETMRRPGAKIINLTEKQYFTKEEKQNRKSITMEGWLKSDHYEIILVLSQKNNRNL